jgi:hypothetical protein
LPKLLAHPLAIAVTCVGSAVFAVLSHRALLAAIPPDCMRASVLRILPAIACMMVFTVALAAAGAGVFYRARPNPTWSERIWATVIGPAVTHGALFTLYMTAYLTANIPAGCESPSLIDLSLLGLCQLAHVAQLTWNARRLTSLRRAREVSHG